jgi:1-acyl-sn-glycerol-3-phosphate acyltransferase
VVGAMDGPGEKAGIDDGVAERVAEIYRLVRRYSRLDVHGLDSIPEGPALLVANHTGWTGWDFANLYTVIHDDLDRDLFTAVHPNWFKLDRLAEVSRRLGMYEASVTETVSILDGDDLVLFFPEGEAGSFKPFGDRYRLEPFQPGFARVAAAAAVPIVPVVIVGGEETHPTLTRLEFTKDLLGVGLPVPATLLPLPVRWRIEVLDPVHPDEYMTPEGADRDVVEDLRADMEQLMQREVQRVVDDRGHPFVEE